MKLFSLFTTVSLTGALCACGGGGGGGDSSEPPANTPPSFDQLQITTQEDVVFQGKIITSDADQDVLTLNSLESTKNGNLQIDLETGEFTYKPNDNFFGQDNFTLSVTDGKTSTTKIFNIAVTAVNDLPSLPSTMFDAIEDQEFTTVLTAIDVDSQTIRYQIVNPTTHGQISINENTGELVYTPNANFFGQDEFVLELFDGTQTTQLTLTLNVAQTKDSPVINTAVITATEDTIANGVLDATDPDNDKLTFAVKQKPTNGIITVAQNTGAYIYQPAENFFGNDQFLLSVSDGDNTTERLITITVAALNDLPQIGLSEYGVAEDTPLNGFFDASDADNDTLRFSQKTNPNHGTLTINPDSGQFQYVPDDNYAGNDEFILSVSDRIGNAEKNINIQIFEVNDAPVINGKVYSTVEDTQLLDTVTADDIDSDTLRFSVVKQTTSGTVTVVSDKGTLHYQPNENFNGADQFTVSVNDGETQVEKELTINVAAVNDAPVAKAYRYNVTAGETLTGTLTATDVDLAAGESLVFSTRATTTNQGTLVLEPSGNFRYDVAQELQNPDTFFISISDGQISSDTTLTVTTTTSAQSDPLYTMQWHLKNTGQSSAAKNSGVEGNDINVETVHEQGILGTGIKVAVVDTGLEIAHEDLQQNVVPERSKNYLTQSNDPTPPANSTGGDHGTSVAGLIASRGYNGIGGRGVAPSASLMGFNWLKNQSFTHWKETHGGEGVTSDVRVVNQSYGSSNVGPSPFNQVSFTAQEAFLSNVSTNTNQGKGIAFVKSAGNEFNYFDTGGYIHNGVNYSFVISEGYFAEESPLRRLPANIAGTTNSNASFYNIVVSALNAGDINGETPLRSSYSSTGSSVWVSAPGGEYGSNNPAMVTTDLEGCDRGYAKLDAGSFNSGSDERNKSCHYTSTFNGTSSAAPVLSGVVALMFDANPELSWRDAKDILARTSVKIEPQFEPVVIDQGDDMFVAEPGWITNAANYPFHNWYGFGAVDAKAAVDMALSTSYKPLPPLVETKFVEQPAVSQNIPESIAGTENVLKIEENLVIESVQILVSINHQRDADLAIELISPSNTRSMLITPRSLLVTDQSDNPVYTGDFANTLLTSNAFYGESSQGNWTIKVTDTNSGEFSFYGLNPVLDDVVKITTDNNQNLGQLTSWSIRFYGHRR